MPLFHRKFRHLRLLFLGAAFTAFAANSALADAQGFGRHKAMNNSNHSHWNAYGRKQNTLPYGYAYTNRSGKRFLHAAGSNRIQYGHHTGLANRAYSHKRNYARHNMGRHDHLSVNINLGSSAYSGFNYGFSSGYTTGYSTFARQGYFPSSRNTRVIVNQPTVVYVNNSSARSGQHVYTSTRTSTVRSGRSLLRDIHGNCFERSTDSRGNEIRTPVAPAVCNF